MLPTAKRSLSPADAAPATAYKMPRLDSPEPKTPSALAPAEVDAYRRTRRPLVLVEDVTSLLAGPQGPRPLKPPQPSAQLCLNAAAEPQRWQPALGLDLDTIRGDFASEGTLADLAVIGSDPYDWRRLLIALPLSLYDFTLMFDGKPIAHLDRCLSDIFSGYHGGNYRLDIRAENNDFHCHFFGEQQLEFDFDAYDVWDQDDYDALLQLVLFFYKTTGKKSVATGFNMHFVCGDDTGGVPWRLLPLQHNPQT